MFSDTDEEVKYALIDTLKLIISSLKQQKSRCIMLLVSMLLDIFFNVGIAGATNILITSITNRNESAFFEYLIIFSVIGITLALFSIIYPFVQSLIQLSVEQFLSLEIYKSIHEKKYSEVVRFNLSDLISRLIYDSRNLSENLLSNSINILYNVILFFASSLYLFYVQWQLALIIIGSGFVTIFLAKKFSTIQQEISLDLQSTQSERRQYLQDYVTNLDYIKTFQKQDVFLKKYNDIREKENKIVAKKTSTLSLLSFLMNVFNQTVYVVSVVILAYLAINNQFDVGTFSAFLLLIGKVQSPFMMIANSYAQIQNAYGSSNRILEVINSNIIHEKPLFEISQKNINPDSNSLLSLVNVDYYDESSTFKLENIFFELEKNEIVAIVGESGAGKTTLMKLMMGLISPNKGIIRLNGEDITGRNEGLLSFFTYVPQESLLFEGSIEENLTLGKEKSDNEKYNALSLSNSEHLLHNFPNSLNVKLSELGKNLSGGQKSRISLSRALLKDASILLIDEGTASLDKKSSNTIVRNLMEHVTFDRSIVMITHRLNEIENVDKVYEIIDGTLIRRK